MSRFSWDEHLDFRRKQRQSKIRKLMSELYLQNERKTSVLFLNYAGFLESRTLVKKTFEEDQEDVKMEEKKNET